MLWLLQGFLQLQGQQAMLLLGLNIVLGPLESRKRARTPRGELSDALLARMPNRETHPSPVT